MTATNTADLRASLIEARDWFESQAKAVSKGCGSSYELNDLRVQRDALDAALAAPTQPAAQAQEPVAWRTFDGEGNYDFRDYFMNERYAADFRSRNPKHADWVEPLYTHLALTAQAQEDAPDDSALEDIAHSANQEALSYGVSLDVFLRLAKTVRLRAATAPQPAAQALDSARVFWQQHTQSDALSMTMAELHDDVELVIRAPQPAAQAQDACNWSLTDDDSEVWESSCGEEWTFIDGGPAENSVRFCHGCGKPVAIEDQQGGSDAS